MPSTRLNDVSGDGYAARISRDADWADRVRVEVAEPGLRLRMWVDVDPEALLDAVGKVVTDTRIAKVMALHTKGEIQVDTIHRGLTPVMGDGCEVCHEAWPCETMQALGVSQ